MATTLKTRLPGRSKRTPGSAFWVPADDLLPLGPHEVLCTDLEGVWIGSFRDGEWQRDEAPVDVVVTHWQELPEVPTL